MHLQDDALSWDIPGVPRLRGTSYSVLYTACGVYTAPVEFPVKRHRVSCRTDTPQVLCICAASGMRSPSSLYSTLIVGLRSKHCDSQEPQSPTAAITGFGALKQQKFALRKGHFATSSQSWISLAVATGV